MRRLERSVLNMASNLIGWVVPVVVNAIAIPFLLHRLGPDAYGLSNLVMVVIGYFSIMDMGMDIASIKLLAEYHVKGDKDSINRLMSTNFQIYMGMGLIGMLVILISADMLANSVFSVPEAFKVDAATIFRLGAWGFLASMLVMWATAVPHGLQRYDIMNGISITTSLVSTGVGVAVVYAGYGVVGFVLTRILTTCMAGVVGFVIAYRLIPTLRLRFGYDREMLRRIWGISAYGVVIRIVGVITGSIDRTLIGIWIGTAAVAAYSVPYMVTIYLNQIMLRAMNFLFPMASEMLHSGHLERLRDIFLRSSRFVLVIATIVIPPLTLLADLFLTLWVGRELTMVSANVFRLLLVGTYLATMTMLISYLLTGLEYIRQFTWMYLLRTAFLAGMCLLLIRLYGILGAGLAILATSVLDIAFGAFSLRVYLKIPVTRFFGQHIRTVALGITLLIPVLLLRQYVTSWFALASVMLGYAVLYLFIGSRIGILGPTEKEVFFIIKRKIFRRAEV